jgi:hypothetical protein
LVASGKAWILSRDPGRSTAVILSSSEQYAGQNGWTFGAEFRFDRGKLIEVSYVSEPV